MSDHVGPPTGLHHIGVVVADLAEAIAGYEQVGLSVERIDTYPEWELEIAFLPVGGSYIELLRPYGTTGMNADFLREHGPGLHHIALEVPDLGAHLGGLQAGGMCLLEGQSRPGAAGSIIAFLGDKPFGGALVELVQRTAAYALNQ